MSSATPSTLKYEYAACNRRRNQNRKFYLQRKHKIRSSLKFYFFKGHSHLHTGRKICSLHATELCVPGGPRKTESARGDCGETRADFRHIITWLLLLHNSRLLCLRITVQIVTRRSTSSCQNPIPSDPMSSAPRATANCRLFRICLLRKLSAMGKTRAKCCATKMAKKTAPDEYCLCCRSIESECYLAPSSGCVWGWGDSWLWAKRAHSVG